MGQPLARTRADEVKQCCMRLMEYRTGPRVSWVGAMMMCRHPSRPGHHRWRRCHYGIGDSDCPAEVVLVSELPTLGLGAADPLACAGTRITAPLGLEGEALPELLFGTLAASGVAVAATAVGGAAMAGVDVVTVWEEVPVAGRAAAAPVVPFDAVAVTADSDEALGFAGVVSPFVAEFAASALITDATSGA